MQPDASDVVMLALEDCLYAGRELYHVMARTTRQGRALAWWPKKTPGTKQEPDVVGSVKRGLCVAAGGCFVHNPHQFTHFGAHELGGQHGLVEQVEGA